MSRTQEERRTGTVNALLDAAIDCLVDHGLAGFTTLEVVRRAGVSQGALFRYFPTKPDLLAATTARLFEELRGTYATRVADLPADSDLIPAALALLWEVFTDARLLAAFDLYTAARTDHGLAAVLQPVAGRHGDHLLDLATALFPDLAAVPAFAAFVDLAVLAMQGLALNQLAVPDPARADRLLEGLGVLAIKELN